MSILQDLGIKIGGEFKTHRLRLEAVETNKQENLVSGTNIKTINGTSVLGSGDIVTTQTTITGNAGTATKLQTARTINGVSFNGSANINVNTVNSEVIKFDTGTTEGTDLYTFNGSSAKTIDIKAGTNVTLTKAAGSITISANDTSVAWSEITSKPTTLSGYGITDSYTKTQTDTAISTSITNLINAAPAALDTLGEIATQLANDESAVSALTNVVSNKVDKVVGKGLSTEDYTTAEKIKLADAAPSSHSHNTVDMTANTPGFMSVNDAIKLGGIAEGANKYILPVASSTVLGGVKAGTNISIDANGVISVNDTSVAWSEITSKPTTLSGYGITDSIQSTLVSGTNIKTINGVSVLGSGDITISGGATLSDDTTTNSTYYPTFAIATSGNMSTAKVSSTKLTFNPSTGTLAATELNSLSDVNKKENIVSITNGLEIINKLNGVEFDWKENGNHSSGVIAQELEKVLPFLVTEIEGTKTVNYLGIIGYLINAVQELSKK